jgi:hypothetical protein
MSCLTIRHSAASPGRIAALEDRDTDRREWEAAEGDLEADKETTMNLHVAD